MASYKELIVWQKSMRLVAEIYRITEMLPATEKYGLVSQMRSSVTSIPSNIAEGSRRNSRKEFRRFLRIAYGSGAELETQLLILKQIQQFQTIPLGDAPVLMDDILKLLNRLIDSIS